MQLRTAAEHRLAEISQDDEAEDMSPADTEQEDRTARKRSHDVDQEKDSSAEPGCDADLPVQAFAEESALDAEQFSSTPTLVLPLDQAEELFPVRGLAELGDALAPDRSRAVSSGSAETARHHQRDRNRAGCGGHHPHRSLRDDAEPSRRSRPRQGGRRTTHRCRPVSFNWSSRGRRSARPRMPIGG